MTPPRGSRAKARKRANGEGSILERPDGRWEARYSLVVDGALKRRSIYARTREDASRELRRALTARDGGVPLPVGRETVGAFLAEWIESHGVRPTSMRRYRQVIRDYLAPKDEAGRFVGGIGRHRLTQLTPVHVRRLYADLLRRGLSPATVQVAHAVLHSALRQAHEDGRTLRNVAALVKAPPLPRREADVFHSEDVTRLLAAARGDRLEALYVLALTAGLRRGELLALRWVDVDLDRGRTVAVTGTLQPATAKGEAPTIREPKSASSRRTVALGDLAVAALQEHRQRQRFEQAAAGAGWRDLGLVFPGPTGGYLPPATLLRRWGDLLSAAELPRVPFHATRHTASSLMAAALINPKVAAEQLGHASAALTLDRYTHVSTGQRSQAAAAVDALLTPI
jgi:integrase